MILRAGVAGLIFSIYGLDSSGSIHESESKLWILIFVGERKLDNLKISKWGHMRLKLDAARV